MKNTVFVDPGIREVGTAFAITRTNKWFDRKESGFLPIFDFSSVFQFLFIELSLSIVVDHIRIDTTIDHLFFKSKKLNSVNTSIFEDKFKSYSEPWCLKVTIDGVDVDAESKQVIGN